jgi:hypothetical protein
MAKSLFDKAKKAAPVKTKAKDQKVRLTVDYPTFFEKVQKLVELNDTMKSAKAKADMISDEIRDVAKEAWMEQYSKTGKNPESVMICQENGLDVAQLMFVPTDRYITINEERADDLRETYGDEIIEEETTFSFDSKMIEKYGEVLSELIMNSPDIDESDKDKIIKATTKFSVAKGTIDNFKKYGDVEEVMEDVKPVVAMKNVEVIKG